MVSRVSASMPVHLCDSAVPYPITVLVSTTATCRWRSMRDTAAPACVEVIMTTLFVSIDHDARKRRLVLGASPSRVASLGSLA